VPQLSTRARDNSVRSVRRAVISRERFPDRRKPFGDAGITNGGPGDRRGGDVREHAVWQSCCRARKAFPAVSVSRRLPVLSLVVLRQY